MFLEIQQRAPLALKANQISQYYSSSNSARTFGSGRPIEQYQTLTTLADPYQTNLQKQLYLFKNYQQQTGNKKLERKIMRVPGTQTGIEQQYGAIGSNFRFTNEELRNMGDLLWRGLTDATRFFSNKEIAVGDINRFAQERFFTGQSKLGSAFKQDLNTSFGAGLNLFDDDDNDQVQDIIAVNQDKPPGAGGGKVTNDGRPADGNLTKGNIVESLISGDNNYVQVNALLESSEQGKGNNQSSQQLKNNPFGFGQYSNKIFGDDDDMVNMASGSVSYYPDDYEESKGDGSAGKNNTTINKMSSSDGTQIQKLSSSSGSSQLQQSGLPNKNLILSNSLSQVKQNTQQATAVATNPAVKQQVDQFLAQNQTGNKANDYLLAALYKMVVQEEQKKIDEANQQKKRDPDLYGYLGGLVGGGLGLDNNINYNIKKGGDVQNMQGLISLVEQQADQTTQAQPGVLADLNDGGMNS